MSAYYEEEVDYDDYVSLNGSVVGEKSEHNVDEESQCAYGKESQYDDGEESQHNVTLDMVDITENMVLPSAEEFELFE